MDSHNNTRNQKGFSLVELIVVIAIMAVLVGVLAPALLHYVEKARVQRDASAISEVVEAARVALMDGELNMAAVVGEEITVSSGGVISDTMADPNNDKLAKEVRKMVPSVKFASNNKADVHITISTMNSSPTFTVTTDSSSTLWDEAISAVQ